MLDLDPNWFYSSLAQSAAGIVGLLGGILATRLQSQVALTTAQRVKSTQTLRDLHYGLAPAILSLTAFERASVDQERLLRAELAKGTKELDLEEWYAPFDRNAPCRTEVSERILHLHLSRQKDVGQLPPLLVRLSKATSVGELASVTAKVSSLQDQLLSDIRGQVSGLSRLIVAARNELAVLSAHAGLRAFSVLLACLFGLCAAGVVLPLAFLSAYSTTHQVLLLAVFALCLFVLLGYVFIQLLQLRRLSAYTSLLPPTTLSDVGA